MIQAKFFRSKDFYTAFCIKGHAGYSESGTDIVCAGVTSAVMTVINGITECACIPADVKVSENEIVLNLAERNQTAEFFLNALKLQLELIEEEYSGTIHITVTEV